MGYFAPDSHLGTVQHLLEARNQEVAFAGPEDPLHEVIAKMAATGISQMPVDSGQGDLRMIEELDILRAIASEEHDLNDSVRDIARPLEGRVRPDDNLSHLQEIFEQNNVAVVVHEGRVLGIINKIDLLEFINNHGRQAA